MICEIRHEMEVHVCPEDMSRYFRSTSMLCMYYMHFPTVIWTVCTIMYFIICILPLTGGGFSLLCYLQFNVDMFMLGGGGESMER